MRNAKRIYEGSSRGVPFGERKNNGIKVIVARPRRMCRELWRRAEMNGMLES